MLFIFSPLSESIVRGRQLLLLLLLLLLSLFLLSSRRLSCRGVLFSPFPSDCGSRARNKVELNRIENVY